MKVCGYCEYGYRLFIGDNGTVYRLPIPYVFTVQPNGGYLF